MAPSTARSSALASASSASAWSLWQASTTSSKCSLPASVATSTPAPLPAARAARAHRRAQARVGHAAPASSARSAREPPRTVCHCGRSLTWIRPWLWQKRIIVATGKRSIWSVGQDQMQPIIGSKYQSRKASPKRWRVRKSPIGSASRGLVAALGDAGGQPVEAQDVAPACPGSAGAAGCCAARTRCSGRSRSIPGPAAGTCTENDMSDGAVSHLQLVEQLAPAAGRCGG